MTVVQGFCSPSRSSSFIYLGVAMFKPEWF